MSDSVQHDRWHSYQQDYYVGQDECDEPVFRYNNVYVHRKCRWKSVVKTNYCANCGCMMDMKAPWEE